MKVKVKASEAERSRASMIDYLADAEPSEENNFLDPGFGQPLDSPDRGNECGEICPGKLFICTRVRGHLGKHVAHGFIRPVHEVW